MALLSNHVSSTTVKALLIGDSGSGKTGALASLVKAGYNLRIADFDNGLDILFSLLSDPKSPYYDPSALQRVSYVTLTDSFKNINGRLMPKQPLRAWPGLSAALGKWPDEIGDILTWTPQDVFVLDSMTFAGVAALRTILALNARLGQRPWISDFGDAQALLESVLQTLYDKEVKCNVVVTSHIQDVTARDGTERGYAATIGKALSSKVGRYFNSVLHIKSSVAQGGPRREIFTSPVNQLELKNSAPYRVKSSYPIATGLADFFTDVRSSVDPQTEKRNGT